MNIREHKELMGKLTVTPFTEVRIPNEYNVLMAFSKWLVKTKINLKSVQVDEENYSIYILKGDVRKLADNFFNDMINLDI